MAEVYNYQKALKQDIVIRKIDATHSLPVGISLRPAVIFIATLVVVYILLHEPLAFFYHVNPTIGKFIYIGFYLGIPFGVVTLANWVKPDGLGLVQYGMSIVIFGIKKILRRTVYYHDRVLPTGYFEASHMAETPVIIESNQEIRKEEND